MKVISRAKFGKFIDKMGFKIGAEIGVHKGVFSALLLRNSKLDKLYCVDIWEDWDNTNKEGKRRYANNDGTRNKETTLKNLAQHEGRFEIMHMTSKEAAKQIDDESLDYIYIDGDHSQKGIKGDLKYWFPKVRIGGVLSGHDYKDGRWSGMYDAKGGKPRNKVKTVINEFVKEHGYKLNTTNDKPKSWWFIKDH